MAQLEAELHLRQNEELAEHGDRSKNSSELAAGVDIMRITERGDNLEGEQLSNHSLLFLLFPSLESSIQTLPPPNALPVERREGATRRQLRPRGGMKKSWRLRALLKKLAPVL